MKRRRFSYSAAIYRHPAELFRAWKIVDEGNGTFTGVLRSIAHGVEVQTETGPLDLVELTIKEGQRYRGAPLIAGTVPRKRRVF